MDRPHCGADCLTKTTTQLQPVSGGDTSRFYDELGGSRLMISQPMRPPPSTHKSAESSKALQQNGKKE